MGHGVESFFVNCLPGNSAPAQATGSRDFCLYANSHGRCVRILQIILASLRGALAPRTSIRASGVLDQRYQPPLGVTVAIDVPLRGLDRAMTSKQLNIAQGTTGFVYKPGRSSDECSAT
jgi:hypothetical protein